MLFTQDFIASKMNTYFRSKTFGIGMSYFKSFLFFFENMNRNNKHTFLYA